MISKATLKAIGFETITDLCDHILRSIAKGDDDHARGLFNELSDGQKEILFERHEELYTYMISGEAKKEAMQSFKNYFLTGSPVSLKTQ